MTSKLELDPRLDPRIKAYFAGIDLGAAKPNVLSREELLAQENTPEALVAQERANALFNAMDSEDVAPSAGLTVRTETFSSSPGLMRSARKVEASPSRLRLPIT